MAAPRGRPPLDADDPSVSLTVRLPSAKFDALSREASTQRKSIRELVRDRLDQWLDDDEQRKHGS